MKTLNAINVGLTIDLNARAPRERTVYTGHVGEGGLQGHSVGACYPFTVYGFSHDAEAPVTYGVLNAATGEDTGPIYGDAARAWTVAELCKSGATDIARIRYFIACGVRP